MFLKISVVILFSYYFCVSISHCWDLAVTTGNEINFLYSNGTIADNDQIIRMNDTIGSITYDPIDKRIFTSIPSKSLISIIDLNQTTLINKNINNQYEIYLNSSIYTNIETIVFEPFTNTLFWIENKKKIMKVIVNTHEITEVLKFDNKEELTSIAVHSCKGYIFWTNNKLGSPTIERATLSGQNQQTIIKQMYLPTAITVDQKLNRIYWADDTDGDYFQIESADLNGNNRVVVIQGRHHRPTNIMQNMNQIFWVDFEEVWSLYKNENEPKKVHKFKSISQITSLSSEYVPPEQCSLIPDVVPSTIVTTSEISKKETTTTTASVEVIKPQTNTNSSTEQPLCLNNGKLFRNLNGETICKCPPSFVGDRCEIPACHNFCIFGQCAYSASGYPLCSCETGYSGLRCEINLCDEKYCLNDGKCSLINNGRSVLHPVCTCTGDYVGQRCEQKNTSEELCRIICEQRDLYQILKSEHDTSLCRCSVYDLNIPNQEFTEMENQSEITYSLLSRLQDPFVLGLIVLVIILIPICMALTTAVCWLRKRPRIKRRIIVNKNVTPLTCRPIPQPDQCEITIENCCNMNICETPCFEPPQLRTSSKSSKTEEKKTLLTNMENGDDFY